MTSSADWETERDSRDKELQVKKCESFPHAVGLASLAERKESVLGQQ